MPYGQSSSTKGRVTPVPSRCDSTRQLDLMALSRRLFACPVEPALGTVDPEVNAGASPALQSKVPSLPLQENSRMRERGSSSSRRNSSVVDRDRCVTLYRDAKFL
jgi:hypothetical protein